ncbi:MAG: hypothetical protein U0234_12325 [Sandaracinus sp.]
MRLALAASMMFLWMCEDPLPPAEHGGVVLSVGAQPLELVAQADGRVTAYPIATSTARGPTTTVLVHVPGVDGVVHDAPLVWDEPSATFVGTIGVAPQVGPISVDVVLAGTPVQASAPVFVVVAPSAPVVVGTAPVTVEVPAPPAPHARVEVVAPPPPHGPTVVVEAPRPPEPRVLVVAPPPPPGPPAVVLVPPGPPGVVLVGPRPPEPRVRVEAHGPPPPRVRVEAHGHFDHGRHGGEGPHWHAGGGHGRH